MARPYATNADLQVFIAGILDYEPPTESDFGDFLDKASEDVLNLIKAEWWPNAVATRYGSETMDVGGPFLPPLDEANINDEALLNITCYRAFSQYIMPYLTKDADEDGDQFSRKIERYTELFANEWEIIKLLPLYDFDGDDAFSDTERRGSYSRRTARR